MTGISLKYVQEKNSNRYLLVNASGSTYSISKMLYHILFKKQQNIGDNDIAKEMNLLFETNSFTGIFIQHTIQNTLENVSGQNCLLQVNEQPYIFMKRTIIAAGKGSTAYRLLSGLFQRNISASLIFVSAFATIYFFCTDGVSAFSGAYHHTITTFGFSKAIMLYGCFLGIILVHELGHATAAYRFGIEPQEIGLGLYFIFPVFYTNVTGIWALPVRERIVVNLAGIYFQLIANLPLLLLFYTCSCNPICFVLITANTIGLLSALNPFLRYDGYWLFSDIFNIPNLHAKSWGIYTSLLKGKPFLKNTTLPLVLYSFLKAIFWVIAYYYCILFFINSIRKIQHLIATQSNGENTISAIGLSSVSFLVLFFIPLKLIWSITKTKQHESN
ncbi:site-2 protease family protein [Parasediminibacterium paludis]|uniref:Site-2 protease family protein n=1 Tax=Parasediminibacterium paludis TaxID=908966 RepID=A0ABV8Q209_9BACT